MERLPAGQRALVGDVLDPTAVGDQTLLSHHVIKVAGIELGEAVLLRDVDLHERSWGESNVPEPTPCVLR